MNTFAHMRSLTSLWTLGASVPPPAWIVARKLGARSGGIASAILCREIGDATRWSARERTSHSGTLRASVTGCRTVPPRLSTNSALLNPYDELSVMKHACRSPGLPGPAAPAPGLHASGSMRRSVSAWLTGTNLGPPVVPDDGECVRIAAPSS
jgi:hypothetical protein